MTWLLLLLVVTNLVAITVAVALWRLHAGRDGERVPEIAELLTDVPAQPGTLGGTRRLISVEILNPIELAGARGRMIGIAGSLAPGITRRVVYDQAVKTMRRQLAEQQVVADVRLHTLRPQRPEPLVTDSRQDDVVGVVEPTAPDPAGPHVRPHAGPE